VAQDRTWWPGGIGSVTGGYHHGVLNVLLLEAGPSNIRRTVEDLAEGVLQQRELYTRARRTPWTKTVRLGGWENGDNAAFFNPLTYVSWGAFDLAAVFLAPDLYLPSIIRSQPLNRTGQHVHRGLLPKKPEGAEASLNADFVQHLATAGALASDSAVPSLPAEARFLALTKLKLNPATSWTRDQTYPRTSEALLNSWRTLEAWRGPAGGERQAALAQGFGWSEFLVVATSPRISDLLRMVRLLRDLPAESYWSPDNESHVFLTTLTSLGYDAGICASAYDDVCEFYAKEPRVGPEVHNSVEEVVNLALDPPRPLADPYRDGGSAIFLRPKFSTYPGHEGTLRDQIFAFSDAVSRENDTAILRATDPIVDWQAGTRDVAGPTLLSGDLSETELARLLCVMQYWLLKGSGGAPDQSDGVPNYFSCHTIVGNPLADRWYGNSVVSPRHSVNHPMTFLGEDLRKALASEFITVVDSLRRLQIPYARTEEILNLLRTFTWANEREVIWEDTITLVPVVLCLGSFLEQKAGWWDAEAKARAMPSTGGSDRLPMANIAKELAHILEDLQAISNAFRSSFYGRHLAGYLTDETPDVNIRYRGSVHQLVAASNLVLDAIVEVVFGPRAALVTVGETLTPEVHGPCDVIVARLNADVLNFPLLLDSLGHEVGHWMAVELLRRTRGAESHRWSRGQHGEIRFRRVGRLLLALERSVFWDSLSDSAIFMEVIADFVELELLSVNDPVSWIRSMMLRTVVLSPATDPVFSPDGATPIESAEQVATLILRVAHVVTLRALLAWDHRATPFGQFMDSTVPGELDDLRLLLSDQCILGQSGAVFDRITSAKAWREFVEAEVIGDAPWLVDERSARLARCFFRALRGHLSARVSSEEVSKGLWPWVRSAMEQLRNGVLAQTRQCLHVRHWLPPEAWEDPETIRERYPECELPWLAAEQPFSQETSSEPQLKPTASRQPQMVIFGRGLFSPWDDDTCRELSAAHIAFLGDLFAMVPQWRARTIERAQAVEVAAGDH
jgi:hypothetical protein